jgi:hypothetical protein
MKPELAVQHGPSALKTFHRAEFRGSTLEIIPEPMIGASCRTVRYDYFNQKRRTRNKNDTQIILVGVALQDVVNRTQFQWASTLEMRDGFAGLRFSESMKSSYF